MTIDPEILKRIDGLSQKLGATSEKVWSVLIRQAHIEAAMDVLWSIVCAALLFILYRVTVSSIRKDLDSSTDFPWIAVAVGSVIAMVILSIFLLACLTELPTPLLNPEYWALHEILAVAGK